MKSKYIGIIIGLLIIVTTSVIAYKLKPNTPSSDKLQVTASFYPVYFLAAEIAGDQAEVVNITPAGAEPHDYEPTPQDIARFNKSSLLILNGANLEVWADDIEQNLDAQKTVIILAGQDLANQQVVEDGKTITDPHVWLSPSLVLLMVDKITQGFIQVDPERAAIYQTNATALKEKLQDLHLAYQQGLVNCQQRNIITSHTAFGYLAKAYQLNQVPITGLSPDAEPSTKQLADIANFAKKNNIKVIFFESLVSPKLAQTIASEIGAQTAVLNPLEGLSEADLAQGKNYFTEMRRNLTNLQTALQCQ